MIKDYFYNNLIIRKLNKLKILNKKEMKKKIYLMKLEVLFLNFIIL